MGADYSFEVKNIEIWVPPFFKHNNSFVAKVSVTGLGKIKYAIVILAVDVALK